MDHQDALHRHPSSQALDTYSAAAMPSVYECRRRLSFFGIFLSFCTAFDLRFGFFNFFVCNQRKASSDG